MKIYFACAISGGRGNEHVYPPIVAHLRNHGEVLTEIFSDPNIFMLDGQVSDHEIFSRDLEWIKEADVIVAEVSTPSFGVGYEIALGELLGKRVLCLRKKQERKLSAMISGNPYKNLIIKEYSTIEEAILHIDGFFNRSSSSLH